ncbi:uncharacterized protein LY89DRAFT_689076 [Mollisia scopiformis]|uniref:Uncharacterized protein n=1 Tax=Mollisia scopiformis TaxID=149040 RepID=A0A194WU66_MOLSC|nr:uncharacterized protein LY89DRAFT_689076 [Mollisia scopiformis]KUJ11152.1 hypothetical protein LY89DRAFT_689076 [Mollisia scopiformis]
MDITTVLASPQIQDLPEPRLLTTHEASLSLNLSTRLSPLSSRIPPPLTLLHHLYLHLHINPSHAYTRHIEHNPQNHPHRHGTNSTTRKSFHNTKTNYHHLPASYLPEIYSTATPADILRRLPTHAPDHEPPQLRLTRPFIPSPINSPIGFDSNPTQSHLTSPQKPNQPTNQPAAAAAAAEHYAPQLALHTYLGTYASITESQVRPLSQSWESSLPMFRMHYCGG